MYVQLLVLLLKMIYYEVWGSEDGGGGWECFLAHAPSLKIFLFLFVQFRF